MGGRCWHKEEKKSPRKLRVELINSLHKHRIHTTLPENSWMEQSLGVNLWNWHSDAGMAFQDKKKNAN